MDRKSFFHNSACLAGLIATPIILTARDKDAEIDPLPADLVKEFVIAGHGNFSRVKEMLATTPTLLYATWDWGGGDFETALEGAGHVGNKEIANYLIGLGARTNLFVLTMLGKTAIVKNYLETAISYELSAATHHSSDELHQHAGINNGINGKTV